MNRTNSPELVGKTAVWNRDEVYALAGYLIRFRFRGEQAAPDYVAGFLNSNYGKSYLRSRAKPSINMSNFSGSAFKEIPLPKPPISLQRRYAAVVDEIAQTRARLESSSQVADSLFRSLVHRAFRGEL